MVFYCAVITGGELPGLSLLNVRGKKPGRDTFLSPWEEQIAIMLLQNGCLLT